MNHISKYVFGIIALTFVSFQGFAAVDKISNGDTDWYVPPKRYLSGVSQSMEIYTYQNPTTSDGRFVVYETNANNIVSADDNQLYDVYVYDFQTKTHKWISKGLGGVAGNGNSRYASMSADGRYVVFESTSSNLVASDTNGGADMFIYDSNADSVSLLSSNQAGVQANGISYAGMISANGLYAIFHSSGVNLTGLSYPANGAVIYLKNLSTNHVTAISQLSNTNTLGARVYGWGSELAHISNNGRYVSYISRYSDLILYDIQNNSSQIIISHLVAGGTWRPVVSDDGRYISFSSSNSSLVSGDNNGTQDMFVKDTTLSGYVRIMKNSGVEINGFGGGILYGNNASADGRYVAYSQAGTGITTGTIINDWNAYVWDRTTLQNKMLVTTYTGAQSRGINGRISADGKYGFFWSAFESIISGYYSPLGTSTLYKRDLVTNERKMLVGQYLGLTANDGSTANTSSISADGRYVAFSSNASNLTDTMDFVQGTRGDTNNITDIFVNDTLTNRIKRISVHRNTPDRDLEAASANPIISDDGKYVVFESLSQNIDLIDINGNVRDVFVRNLQSNTSSMGSYHISKGAGNAASRNPDISSGGKYVVFSSLATNFDNTDTNGVEDIYIQNTATKIVTRVSTSSTSGQANGLSRYPVISADGRYVAFISDATNLVVGDTNGVADVFLKDLQTNTTTRVSVSSAGGESNGSSNNGLQISPDGRYVVFGSTATNLVAGNSSVHNIYMRDVRAGTTILVSVDTAGTAANDTVSNPQVSQGGRYVVFVSEATNLVAGDTNGVADVFMRDTVSNQTTRIVENTSGGLPNGASNYPSITPDGRYISFGSLASNLVSNDVNGKHDIFKSRVSVVSTTCPQYYSSTLASFAVCLPNAFKAKALQQGSIYAYFDLNRGQTEFTMPASVVVTKGTKSQTLSDLYSSTYNWYQTLFRNSMSVSMETVSTTDGQPMRKLIFRGKLAGVNKVYVVGFMKKNNDMYLVTMQGYETDWASLDYNSDLIIGSFKYSPMGGGIEAAH